MNLSSIKRFTYGYCFCCQKITSFVSTEYWLRDYYICTSCGSVPRQRAIMKVLNDKANNYKDLVIHESSPSGPTFELLKNIAPNYTYSYFYDNIELGEVIHNDVKCTNQNIEKLKFANNSFDIFITQDVMEHVNNPKSAFKEISRVLKPGGLYIFTVPLYPWIKTRPRIKIKNGAIEHILPAVYHGNPISDDGSLVTYDWGSDIADKILKWSGMQTEIISFPQSEKNYHYGLEADFLQVLVSQKKR